jgi:hypothetical protein
MRRMRNAAGRIIPVLLWLICSLSAATAQSARFQVLRNLQGELLYYNARQEAYLPWIEGNDVSTTALHLALDLAGNRDQVLVLELNRNTSLYIDQQLVYYFEKPVQTVLQLDSLWQRYGADSLGLSFYQPEGDFSDMGVYLAYLRPYAPPPVNPLEQVRRPVYRHYDYFKLILLLLVIYYALLWRAIPRNFNDFFNLSHLFLNWRRKEGPTMLTNEQLLLILALSALISFFLWIYQTYTGALDALLWFGHPLLVWLQFTFSVFVLVVLKYLLIRAMSALFGLSEISYPYFFESLILSQSFYTAGFLVTAAVGIKSFGKIENLTSYFGLTVAIFYFFRLFIMYFKIRMKVDVRFLHLFSYLCTTELLPIIVGLKFLLMY